jgi:hypothetical protein
MTCKALAVWLAAVPALLSAQEALPKAEEIMDRYVAVTGGREAYQNRRNEVRKAKMELAGRDVSFTVTTYRAAPGKAYSIMEIPGAGKVEEGTDGKVAWSLSAARGPVIKEGFERDMALYGATLDVDLRGLEQIDGRPCYKLLLRWGEGSELTRFYDKETGLVTKGLMRVKLPQGQFTMETSFQDYRSAGGVLQPHKTTMKLPGQEVVGTLQGVETNVEIEPARFALPEPVKALLAKKQPPAPETPR